MTSRVVETVRAPGGVAGRPALVAATSDDALRWAVGTQELRRAPPRTDIDPASADQFLARCRAATEYAGEDAVVSHLSALRVWVCRAPTTRPSPSSHRTRAVRAPMSRTRGCACVAPAARPVSGRGWESAS